MAYSAEISRQNPSCFLFLIDQSGSMSDPFGGEESGKCKADTVADAINSLLRNLSIRCAKDEGIRDYFHIGVIGYGVTVGPAFSGPLSGKELVGISEVAENPARIEQRMRKVEDGVGGLVDEALRMPIWFEPVANGGTPMRQGFNLGIRIINDFLTSYPNCFPPVVIHLTDGESTEGDPISEMREMTSCRSSDGNTLLINCHMSSSSDPPIAFPSSPDGLPDDYARMLFETASELTPSMRDRAKDYEFDLISGTKGFTFNE